jgi:hypothetical protein
VDLKCRNILSLYSKETVIVIRSFGRTPLKPGYGMIEAPASSPAGGSTTTAPGDWSGSKTQLSGSGNQAHLLFFTHTTDYDFSLVYELWFIYYGGGE